MAYQGNRGALVRMGTPLQTTGTCKRCGRLTALENLRVINGSTVCLVCLQPAPTPPVVTPQAVQVPTPTAPAPKTKKPGEPPPAFGVCDFCGNQTVALENLRQSVNGKMACVRCLPDMPPEKPRAERSPLEE